MPNIKDVKIENLTHLFNKFDDHNLGLYGATYLLEDFCKHFISVKKRDVSYEIKVIEKLQIPDALKQQEIDRIIKESHIQLSEEERISLAKKILVMMDILGMPGIQGDTLSKEEVLAVLERNKNKRAELKCDLIEQAYKKHVK